MKPIFKNISGVLISVCLTQFAWAAGNGQGQTGQLPVVVGKGSLTVAGEGYWNRKDYESGDSPSLYDFVNDGLTNGVYRYEFRSFPDGAGASARQQNLTRAEGEGISRRRGNAKGVNTVSGLFEVQGGEIIYR
jgi:hypothetical protein